MMGKKWEKLRKKMEKKIEKKKEKKLEKKLVKKIGENCPRSALLFFPAAPQPPSMPPGGRGSSQLTSAWKPSARRSRSCARSGEGCSRGSWPSSSTTVMSMGSLWRMTTSEGCPSSLPWHCWPRKSRIFFLIIIFFPKCKAFPSRAPSALPGPAGCSKM